VNNKIASGILIVVVAALPCAGWCARFACKPPNGPTIYEDFPPPECRNLEIRELNPDGSLKGIIEPPLTEEQKKAKSDRDRRRTECMKQNQVQHRKDRSLLETYPSEDDLLRARDRSLASQYGQIEKEYHKLRQLKAARKRLSEEEEFYTKSKPPDELKTRLDDNASEREMVEHAIAVKFSEMQRINDSFDADLKRYRDLVAGTAKAPFQCEQ
jgi:hypothetical protein